MRKRAALGLLREGRWGAVVIMALSGCGQATSGKPDSTHSSSAGAGGDASSSSNASIATSDGGLTNTGALGTGGGGGGSSASGCGGSGGVFETTSGSEGGSGGDSATSADAQGGEAGTSATTTDGGVTSDRCPSELFCQRSTCTRGPLESGELEGCVIDCGLETLCDRVTFSGGGTFDSSALELTAPEAYACAVAALEAGTPGRITYTRGAIGYDSTEGVIAILEGRRAAIVSSVEALDASYTGQRWATVFLASAEYYATCAAETDPSAQLACLELRC